MAILGSVGVIGIVTFCIYLIAIFQPLRASTWGKGGDASQAIGGALATASVLGLIQEKNGRVHSLIPRTETLEDLFVGAVKDK